MTPLPPDDEHRDPPSGGDHDETEGEAEGDSELPPPATWAGKQSREPEPEEPVEDSAEQHEDDHEIGSGITDEFSLEGEVPPDQGPSEEPPPVEEPPDPERPEPIEEPHAPGAPPSGDETEFHPLDEEGEEEDDLEPESEEFEAEPDSEELEAESDEHELESDSEEHELEPESEELEVEEETGEREPVTAMAPGPPPKIPTSAGPKKQKADDKADKPPRAGLWPRFIAAALVIVISMATATATTVLLYFQDIADAIGDNLPGVGKLLENVEGGEPQTVLILGSDIRPDIEEKGRSDTTMLLRLDAGEEEDDPQVLSLLSLPRDLRVNIPGYGIGKLNEAYTVGGAKLTTEVVGDLTGLDINHVVNIDFTGFAEAVDAVECVFVDIDRHYFHSNEGIFDDELKYAEIDIEAGYQQLCGLKALQYVRFRHDDNDLVRAARQQSFLREARAKVPPEELFKQRDEFIDIFTKYTTSDIDNPVAMLDVLKLFVELRDAPVRRIEFQGDIGGPDSAYVTASNEQIKVAVQQFLGNAPAPTEKASEGGGEDSGGDGGGAPKDSGGDSGGGDGGSGGGGDSDAPAAPAASLIDASDAASRYALQFDGKLRFPVIAPVKLKPGSTYSDESRAYSIDTYDGEHYPSYKMVFELTGPFGVPEYYGAMGTKWKDPPILETPSETRQIGDREYLLFYEGDRLQVVGFKTPEGSYWISNTLTGALSEDEMLGVAESMKPFSPQQ